MRKGQSIIELLIAVALGAFLAGAAAGLIAPAIKSSAEVAQVQVGAALGTELMNNVRVWVGGDWHNLLNLSTGTAYHYYLNTSVSPFTVADGDENILTSNGTFARYFYVNDVYRDSNGNITTSGGTYDPSTKQVTVVYKLLNQAGSIASPWMVASASPVTQGPAQIFIYGGNMYEISLPNQELYFTPISATGSVGGPWNSTSTFILFGAPNGGVAEYDGYLYAGSFGNGEVNMTTTVFYGQLDPTNGISSAGWLQTTPFPELVAGANFAIYRGYLYAFGGVDNSGNSTTTTWVVPINTDGTLGTWSRTTPTPLPTTHGPYEGESFYNNYVYFIGGASLATTTEWYAPVSATGSIGTWTTTINAPFIFQRIGMTAVGDNMYLIGGASLNFITSTVYSSPIATSGALTGWRYIGILPVAVGGSWATANSNFIYNAGGWTATNTLTWSSTLYYDDLLSGGYSAVSSSFSTYLTRNLADTYKQSDWSNGPGEAGPATGTNSFFSTSTGITYSTPGALSLSLTSVGGVSSSFVQVATGVIANATSMSFSFGSPLAASDTIVVGTAYNESSSSVGTGTISDTLGSHFTSIFGQLTSAGDNSEANVWYATNTPGGNDTVKISVNQSQQKIIGQAFEYQDVSGIDSSTWNTALSGTSMNPGSVTTADANDLLFAFGQSPAGVQAGAGFQSRAVIGPTASEDDIVDATGSYSNTMTAKSSNEWLAAAVDFILGQSTSSPNISSGTSQHWAWNDTIGWINFYGTNSINVSNSGLTGYASSSAGDISLDCHTTRNGNICNGTNNYQVKNDGTGDLSGWAWNDQFGWIEFFWGNSTSSPSASTTAVCQSYGSYCGVSISNNGQFQGYAWNDNIGWISFNCSNNSGCGTSSYYVQTTWSPPGAYGYLESTVYDTGITSGAQLNAVTWQGTQPSGAQVGFQFAVSNSPSGPWNFEGPSGDAGTWYTGNQGAVQNLDYSLFNNFRYFEYLVELWQGAGSGASSSPTVNDVIINWSP